jgi:hypothetical protein
MQNKLYSDGMSLEDKLLIWFKERSEIDMACGGELHENTPLLKEAADTIAALKEENAELTKMVLLWEGGRDD